MAALGSRALAAALTLGTLSVRPSAAQTEKHFLRISDAVGQTNRYRVDFSLRMRGEVSGEGELEGPARELVAMLKDGMSVSTAMEYEQRLVEVDSNGVRTFELRWWDYRVNGELAGKEIPPPAGYLEAARDLLSETVRVRTMPTGQTVGISYSHPRLAGLVQSLQQADRGMPAYLPEGAVGIGDRWTGTAQLPLGLGSGDAANLELTLEHKLEDLRQGPEGLVAVIALSGEYSRLQGAEDTSIGVPLHMEASLQGSVSFDVSAGRFIDGHYEIDLFAIHAEHGIEIQLTGHADGDQSLIKSQ